MPLRLRLAFLSTFALAGGVMGCQETSSELIRDSAGDVPFVESDPALATQLRDSDALEGDQPRFTAFANGENVRYWALPGDTRAPARAYQLCTTLSAAGCAPAPHPLVLETLPGEPGYTPFVRLERVLVRRSGMGRHFPSFDAVSEGVRRGLLEAPQDSGRYTHVVVVGDDVRLEVDQDVYAAPTRVYARGFQVTAFDFTETHGARLLEESDVPVRNVYVLRRSGEALPISEPMRELDLTGDGDQRDSSNIFGVDLDDFDYTPLWQVVQVEVSDAYQGIDTFGDQGQSDYREAHDMFDVDIADYSITPIPGAIVSHEETGVLLNCPLQSAPGSL